ncbi:transposase [Streptomyces sp. NBC_01353]|nr:Tn3 family transposase [Streptomyces sp. NBC_01353]
MSKTLHIVSLADERGYRLQTKVQADLQEGRHFLARKISTANGQLYQRFQDGIEDRIGALSLVLNALVRFSTRYMGAAVTQLRASGFDVREEDVARLPPCLQHHINMLGRYSFRLPDLPEWSCPRRGAAGAGSRTHIAVVPPGLLARATRAVRGRNPRTRAGMDGHRLRGSRLRQDPALTVHQLLLLLAILFHCHVNCEIVRSHFPRA